MKLGGLEFERTAALAPMAGVGDRAFREICRSYGSAFSIAEMASAKGLLFSDQKTQELLVLGEDERPGAVQLFGDDPQTVAAAAKLAAAYHPDWIDLNMGCPAPKIAGNGAGSALMKDPKLAGEIVGAVVQAVELPVTVKFRKGWDSSSVNAVEFAKRCQENGAAALAIHGRTREQMYAPPADWDIIAAVKEAVQIPVIGNGDVDSVESCMAMYRHTNCDLVMIGRGALGQPWLFRQIEEYVHTGSYSPAPEMAERMEVLVRHMELACRYKGEYVALREGRKHAAWYMKGVRGASEMRRRAGSISTLEELRQLAADMVQCAQQAEA